MGAALFLSVMLNIILVICVVYMSLTNRKLIKPNYYFSKYISHPRLQKPEDKFYIGVGPNWGVDLDENRYFKTYDPKYLTSNIEYTVKRFEGKVKIGQELTNELFDSID